MARSCGEKDGRKIRWDKPRELPSYCQGLRYPLCRVGFGKKWALYFNKDACLNTGNPGRLNTQLRVTQNPTRWRRKASLTGIKADSAHWYHSEKISIYCNYIVNNYIIMCMNIVLCSQCNFVVRSLVLSFKYSQEWPEYISLK